MSDKKMKLTVIRLKSRWANTKNKIALQTKLWQKQIKFRVGTY